MVKKGTGEKCCYAIFAIAEGGESESTTHIVLLLAGARTFFVVLCVCDPLRLLTSKLQLGAESLLKLLLQISPE